MANKGIKKKGIDVEQVQPGLTPPPPTSGPAFPSKPRLTGKSKKRDIPEGLWSKCPRCESLIYDRELDDNLKVCPKCEHHFTLTVRDWPGESSVAANSTSFWACG